jgi:hypothetical protein
MTVFLTTVDRATPGDKVPGRGDIENAHEVMHGLLHLFRPPTIR